MKTQWWARSVVCINVLFGLLGSYAGIVVMRAVRGGMNEASAGPEKFGMGMFVGGFGLILLLIGLTLLSLAGGAFAIHRRLSHHRAPGPAAKAFLAFATLIPVFLIGAAGAYWLLK